MHECFYAQWHERHQMETFSALLALCAGNSPVTGEFPWQRPVTRSYDVFFDLRLNKQLSKQWWGWWFETPSSSLWRHCNGSWVWEGSWRSVLSYPICFIMVTWTHVPHHWPFCAGNPPVTRWFQAKRARIMHNILLFLNQCSLVNSSRRNKHLKKTSKEI